MKATEMNLADFETLSDYTSSVQPDTLFCPIPGQLCYAPQLAPIYVGDKKKSKKEPPVFTPIERETK